MLGDQLNRYRFTATWVVPVDPGTVFGALVDIGTYPTWWADVRSVTAIDSNTAELVCRSVLPYQLVLRATRAEQDEHGGRLRLALSGDLEGYIGCELDVFEHRDRRRPARHGARTRLSIAQEVVVRKQLLRRVAPIARPLLRANHTAMMRRGQRGFRRHLRGPAQTFAGSGGGADS
ncbi:hypothetical protein EV191_11939 [Tamaricihabitans halophyticus]|uniref:Polyketide cyclase/dehydrase/lipid transport protein n=1 Tax=Tamaricihabitans halophyticus TaxID=1262583 RepID=A0A4R2Q9F3_9PSEU|nr:polyketide cyclase [Tamaricihabitans halophyticus]TCP44754.1 hypothetical protein EV191_11939 [Tamaricihabitans halophyticus]